MNKEEEKINNTIQRHKKKVGLLEEVENAPRMLDARRWHQQNTMSISTIFTKLIVISIKTRIKQNKRRIHVEVKAKSNQNTNNPAE